MSAVARLGRLRGRAAVDPNVLRHLQHVVAGPVVVCEPRSADRAACVINAWHVVDTYRRPDAQLVVHGQDAWWSDPRVGALVQALALPNVWLHPPASDPVRAALLEGADVYVSDRADPDGVPERVAQRAAQGALRVVPVVASMGAAVLAEAIAEAMAAARAVPGEAP